MSNWIFYDLDVLASNPNEINRIAEKLNRPSRELADWVARQSSQKVSEIAEVLKELLEFKTVKNLGYIDNAVNKARKFSASFKDRYSGIVRSHLFEVAEAFPRAIFLLEYGDPQASYAGKQVIRAGEVVQEVFDGDQQTQGVDWALLDIFAPFRAEWDDGRTEFGGLWQPWLEAMMVAVRQLKDKQSPNQTQLRK